jgi:hypothetical protein
MGKIKLIYIAGKFSDQSIKKVFENTKKAEAAGTDFLNRGWAVIVPHKMYWGINKDVAYDIILASCLEIMSRCDTVFFLKGWEESFGAREEHVLALKLKKEIQYE